MQFKPPALLLLACSLPLGVAVACKMAGSKKSGSQSVVTAENDPAPAASASSYFPAYFEPWICAEGSETCSSAWGRTGRSGEGLVSLMSQELNAEVPYYFTQYSRPNDDTPAGMNPQQLLQSEVGGTQAQRLLQRNEDGLYENRSEVVGVVGGFVENQASFYEVFAATFAVGAQRQPNGTHRVVFANILESTSGRYESAPEDQGFTFAAEAGGSANQVGYGTQYPEGTSAKSPTRDRIGALSTAATRVEGLEDGDYQASLAVRSRGGQGFINCRVDFSLPLDKTTTFACERFKFPPLLVMRTNTAASVDQLRYRKPPEEGGCFSSETVADGGLSNNSLFGAVLRQEGLCLDCHVKYGDSAPFGGDLLCPPAEDPDAAFSPEGNPKNASQISDAVRRYFENPVLESVPKQIRAMKSHFDSLKGLYCAEKTVSVSENGTSVEKNGRQILDDWVREYNPANPLDYDAVCAEGSAG